MKLQQNNVKLVKKIQSIFSSILRKKKKRREPTKDLLKVFCGEHLFEAYFHSK
jgi:hypothetical protein